MGRRAKLKRKRLPTRKHLTTPEWAQEKVSIARAAKFRGRLEGAETPFQRSGLEGAEKPPRLGLEVGPMPCRHWRRGKRPAGLGFEPLVSYPGVCVEGREF